MNRAECLAADRADPLRRWRDEFILPRGRIYLDGNSLGPLSRTGRARLKAVIEREWARDLIQSWTKNGWVDGSTRIGAKIAPLIGAKPAEVIVADSTSVNLFKALAGALALRPERRVIVSERGNFPTDIYMAEGLAKLLGQGHELRLVDGDVTAALGPDVAAVMVTEIDYRTGARHDMAAVTRAAHEAGALTIWDLSHSVGAMPIALNRAAADFAVGCGYKYLNGGPGGPAFLFVAARHQDGFVQPLSGWLGHADPFEFASAYRPARGILRAICGTPPVLSMAALEAGVDLMRKIDMKTLRAKSLALTDLFIARVEERCAGHGLVLATPREHARRGSQVSFRHKDGYAIVQALIARDVVGDFREPDFMRFGFAAPYLRFVDVFDAAEHLRAVLESGEWKRAAFRKKRKVT